MAVPTEQYRTEYAVAVPAGYTENFLAVSAPPAGAVLVDGVPVTLTPFAGGTYRAARLPVSAGAHRVSCPGTCAVLVHGYASAVGYMFPAGLDLQPIGID